MNLTITIDPPIFVQDVTLVLQFISYVGLSIDV